MNYFCHLGVLLSIYAILGLSLDLIVGQCGRMCLCHGAFYGAGAFCSALLTTKAGFNWFAAAGVAMAFCALLALAISYSSLKLVESRSLRAGHAGLSVDRVLRFVQLE